jgi:hypothetical protein
VLNPRVLSAEKIKKLGMMVIVLLGNSLQHLWSEEHMHMRRTILMPPDTFCPSGNNLDTSASHDVVHSAAIANLFYGDGAILMQTNHVKRGIGEDILPNGMIALLNYYSSPAERFTGMQHSRLRRRKSMLRERLPGMYLHHCLYSFFQDNRDRTLAYSHFTLFDSASRAISQGASPTNAILFSTGE